MRQLPADPHRPRGFDGLDQILAAGVAWLASDQPAGAVMSHHGRTTTTRYGGLAVNLCISGWRHLPVVRIGYGDSNVRLTVEDVAALRELVERVAPVAHEWNGAGQRGVSFALDLRLGRGPAGALDNYRRGCPAHHTVFCGMGTGLLPGEAACTWYANGHRQVARPQGCTREDHSRGPAVVNPFRGSRNGQRRARAYLILQPHLR